MPASKALIKYSRNRRRNSRESTRTGKKNPARQETHSRAIRRETTAGDHTMQMGMMKQVRAPSMEHGKKADLGAQVFGISGDGE